MVSTKDHIDTWDWRPKIRSMMFVLKNWEEYSSTQDYCLAVKRRIAELEEKYTAALKVCRAIAEWGDQMKDTDSRYSVVKLSRDVVEKEDDGSV